MEFKNQEYLGNEGYALMGAVFEVYRELGAGLSEEIYQESLEWELGLREVPFNSKSELAVFYKGHQLKKTYIPDLLVSGEIVTELKAVKCLTHEHEQQLLNYMHITKKAVGYLINFAAKENVEWKRFILKDYIPDAYQHA
jgi:GxxExxY protein